MTYQIVLISFILTGYPGKLPGKKQPINYDKRANKVGIPSQ